jgi:transposase
VAIACGLEQGRFHPEGEADKQRLDWTELKLILEGIDLQSVRRFKRYDHPVEAHSPV